MRGKTGDLFLFQNKRNFKISDFNISEVSCILKNFNLEGGHYSSGVTFLHVECALFYEKDTYSSGKGVIFLRKIMTGGHLSA